MLGVLKSIYQNVFAKSKEHAEGEKNVAFMQIIKTDAPRSKMKSEKLSDVDELLKKYCDNDWRYTGNLIYNEYPNFEDE